LTELAKTALFLLKYRKNCRKAGDIRCQTPLLPAAENLPQTLSCRRVEFRPQTPALVPHEDFSGYAPAWT